MQDKNSHFSNEIESIKRICKNEIIVYTRLNDKEVNKQLFTLEGVLKKSKIQNVTEKLLVRRKARDTVDFMFNMVENFEYEIC